MHGLLLGTFGTGQMVKEFEDASFIYNSTAFSWASA